MRTLEAGRGPIRVRTVLSLVILASAAQANGVASDDGVPREVVDWLRDAARPIESFEIGATGADLAPLARIVGDARIVAIGEATHGSSEFLHFKGRAFAHLVEQLGFTDLILENDWAQTQQANAWVERGEGDLAQALLGVSGLWRTAGMRELLVWMRAWNADPAHARKVRIHGMDLLQTGNTAQARVMQYFRDVDPDIEDALGGLVQDIARRVGGIEDADLEGFVGIFDELEADWIGRSSEESWALARQHAVVLVQSYRGASKRGPEATAWRDICMAENARWILEHGGPDARVVVSAHNGHVSRWGLGEAPGFGRITSVGSALGAVEDLSMVVIGTAFARGAFYAYPATGGAIASFTIDAPIAGSIEARLVEAGAQQALYDLRAAPAEGAVRAWLDERRPHIGVGGNWDPAWIDQAEYARATTLPVEYDVVLFLPEVTATERLGD